MRKIVIAWELGGNHGHMARNIGLAQCLRGRGYAVTFALRASRLPAELLERAGFDFVACPTTTSTPRSARRRVNYSHLLAGQGYCDVSILRACVRGWIDLLRTKQAVAVVIDHAPGALLAARIMGIRAVLVSAPFSIPPLANPLPSIRPWEQIPALELLRADEQLLRSINEVLTTFGSRPLEQVCELFASSAAYLTTFRELDCYQPRSGVTYVGAISGDVSHPGVHWLNSAGKRVFAYLRPTVAGLEPLLSALSRCEAEVVCVIAGAPDSMIDRLRRTRLRASNVLLDVSTLLPDADVVVSYGGAGLIVKSLRAGVPMLLVPHVLEQHLNALQVSELGAGVMIDAQRTQARFSDSLARLMCQPQCRAAARRFAERYVAHDPRQAAEQVATGVAAAAETS